MFTMSYRKLLGNLQGKCKNESNRLMEKVKAGLIREPEIEQA